MSGTYGDMQTRIADELARTDLTSQIQLAILSAIAHYERRRFYFNETTSTFSTVANQEYYSSSNLADIATLVEIDSIRVTISSTRYTLIPRDFAYLDAICTNASATGNPTDYCYYQEQIRLYPIPSTARTVTMAYIKRLATLSASGDSNAWTTDAEELIRQRAKCDLFANVIRSPDEAMACRQYELIALDNLTAETVSRISTGHIRPTAF